MGKKDRQPDPAPAAAPALPPAPPVIFVEDLSSDDFKFVLQQCGDDVISPIFAGVKARNGGGELAARFNFAYRNGGHGNGADTQPEASVTTFNQSGYVAYVPPGPVADFVGAWKSWAAIYGPHTGHGQGLKSVQGLVDAANAARAAMGKKPMAQHGH
jgi:hypothetical protein